MSDPRQVLINLVAGLSLADHMGDVWDDAYEALKQIGIEVPAEPWELTRAYAATDDHALADWLARDHGATTVWGTSLISEEDEEDEEATDPS